jgi:hypothetical protein
MILIASQASALHNLKKERMKIMKKILILFFTAALFFNCSDDDDILLPGGNDIVGGGNKDKNFTFSGGTISQEVLNNYLMRAVTQAELLSSDGFYNDGEYLYQEDDERMLINIGAKFIGRSIYSWGFETHFINNEWLGKAKAKIDRLHAKDADLIFQAAIFEVVSIKVNNVPVPAWVFEAFGKSVETRNFKYDDMKNLNGNGINQWGDNTIVPDITREETRMFFYYMAVKYMEAGIEAIHFGQVGLIAMDDAANNYAGWRDILAKVREVAKTKARRGTILCDGHMTGVNIAVDGKLLFDFGSFPLRIKEISGDPEKGELKKFYNNAIYGLGVGGVTPSGWNCERSPYIVEFDNFGYSTHPGVANIGDHFIWGYDEISWLYRQKEEYRNEFLWHAVDYLARVDPIGFVQMPGSRVVNTPDIQTRYRCNTHSENCPQGLSQEETIKAIWEN